MTAARGCRVRPLQRWAGVRPRASQPGRRQQTPLRPQARGKRELQGVLGAATGDALHAGGALDGADLDEAVDGKILRTGLGALAALDAGSRRRGES